jgi:hypothetical protein
MRFILGLYSVYIRVAHTTKQQSTLRIVRPYLAFANPFWYCNILFLIIFDINIGALVVDSPGLATAPKQGLLVLEKGERGTRATTCPVKRVRCVQYSADQRGEHRRPTL